ncbi:MAG: hypothetical protein MK135_09650, partial [Polyangiaceae bacterium]|nr:hypothetical protein [Polyangiaceae bacterium]
MKLEASLVLSLCSFSLLAGCASVTADPDAVMLNDTARGSATAAGGMPGTGATPATGTGAVSGTGASPATGAVSGTGASSGNEGEDNAAGGSAAGGSAAGGSTSSGGMTGSGSGSGTDTFCQQGETVACADEIPSRPVGDAPCALSGAGFDLSVCVACELTSEKSCAGWDGNGGGEYGNAICVEGSQGPYFDNSTCGDCPEGEQRACTDASTPVGSETCTDSVWVADCRACNVGETIDCAGWAGNGGNEYGQATCVNTGSGPVFDGLSCAECEEPMTKSCAELDPTRPVGEVSCVGGSFDASGCRVCAEGSQVACSTVDAVNVVGDATCLPDGSGYDTSNCKFCSSGSSVLCLSLDSQFYSGGSATCLSDGSAYDESTCERCGNDRREDGEVCDGSVPDGILCSSPEIGFVGDDTPITSCTSSCTYDTLVCSICDVGIAAGKCLGEDPASPNCSGSSCANSQCGAGESCSMDCSVYQASTTYCSGLSCAPGAICTLSCRGQGYRCAIDCPSGSNCNLNANLDDGLPSGQFNCADGGECSYSFQTGRNHTQAEYRCERGAECTFTVNGYETQVRNIVCEGTDAGSNATGSGTTPAVCNLNFQGDDRATYAFYCGEGATCSCTSSSGANGNTCSCSGPGC